MFYKIFCVIAVIMLNKDMYMFTYKYIVGINGRREKITLKEFTKACVFFFYHLIVIHLSYMEVLTH